MFLVIASLKISGKTMHSRAHWRKIWTICDIFGKISNLPWDVNKCLPWDVNKYILVENIRTGRRLPKFGHKFKCIYLGIIRLQLVYCQFQIVSNPKQFLCQSMFENCNRARENRLQQIYWFYHTLDYALLYNTISHYQSWNEGIERDQ